MKRPRPMVACSENEDLAAYMMTKWQKMADQRPKEISESLEVILSKAYSNICSSKTPIKTVNDLSQIKGVEKRILKLMEGFFEICSGGPETEHLPKKGKENKGTKRYLPQKNSVAYALLIALYRGTTNGNEFMLKQELIDAAEASGLSRVPIAPEKGKGKPGRFGSSPRDWYSGWSCMKILITKELVNKSSFPAKYMLTQEGEGAARECLMRSGLPDPSQNTAISERIFDLDWDSVSDVELVLPDSAKDVTTSFIDLSGPDERDVPLQRIEMDARTDVNGHEAGFNFLSLPPLSYGERFEDVYEVILILDNREQFANKGSRSRRIIDTVCSQFKIKIEVRWLAIGDGIWIVRHKQLHTEYVLDFIVERKKVDDLCCSIRDNRYKDQKLRLLRCGLKKLIYLVEGDPNFSKAAESIKTACFTTEILEGFDVLRTAGLADTLKMYGHLTQAITQYYKEQRSEEQCKRAGVCPSFSEFIRRCQDFEKLTVSDVFAIQLMQVPQVTEDYAIAVLDLYPTLVSLAHAYSQLDGDVAAQEEMLKKESKSAISAVASRNIFQLVWSK